MHENECTLMGQGGNQSLNGSGTAVDRFFSFKFLFPGGKVTNLVILLVFRVVRIFLSLTTVTA